MYKLSNKKFLKNFYFDVNTHNILRKGTISNDDEEIRTQHLQNIKLLSYQLKNIKRMNFMENGGKFYYDSKYYKTKIGILCNKSGSGKSFCILERIISQPKLPEYSIPTKSLGQFLHIFHNKSVFINTNLIVTSKILLYQWEFYIKTYTNLNYKSFQNNDGLTKIPILLQDNKCDIILIIDTAYNKFANFININNNNLVFSRIIFDSADSLNIKNCSELNSLFIWFLTSKPENLIFLNNIVYNINCDIEVNNENYQELISSKLINWKRYNGFNHNGYVYNIFKKLYSERFDINYSGIIVKCSNTLLLRYANIPKYNLIKLKCYLPNFAKYIKNYSKISLKKIEYDDYIITNSYKIYYTLDSLISILEKKKYNSQRIQELRSELDSCNSNCPICYEQLSKPLLITPCCQHTFHIKCIFKLYNNNSASCPYCNLKIKLNECYYFDKLIINKNKLSKINKLTNLLDSIIGKTLVYISDTNYKILNNKYKKRGCFIRNNNIDLNKNNIFYISNFQKIRGFHSELFDNLIITQAVNKPLYNDILNITQIPLRKKKLNVFDINYANLN